MFRGQILSDRYKIRQAIGGGGMANVYLARDIILDRDVAIKVLRMEYAHDEEFIERFRREAQSTINLSHRNIVNILDVGEEVDEDIYYIVMEYVKGMTLKQYIQMYGPLPVDEAIDVMSQVTAAISHAHANGIIHRDIKPQNILIDNSGKVKVTDFGIAMALSGTSITQTNSVLGSVHYLSPEQARGGTAIKKSDIYSLGIVFFELLTGRLPFSGDTAVSIALKHLQSETPSVRRWNSEIPQSVENIVLKATAKNPFHRYENATQLEEDLATALLPERMNEKKFTPPQEVGEETKAIPIITSDNRLSNNNGETIVHQKTEEKHKKKKKGWIWAVSIISILFIAGIAALFLLPKWFMPKEVEIPNQIKGEMTAAEATVLLKGLNLEVEVEEEYSDEYEKDIVLYLDPEEGSTVREGATVTIVKSLGKEPSKFENYIGRDIDRVIEELVLLGYKQENMIIHEEPKEGIPKDEIYKQSPTKDAEVINKEEQEIEFWVSAGEPTYPIPNFIGFTLQEIYDYMDKNKTFSIDIDESEYGDRPKGEVFKQNPEYTVDGEIEKGSNITVYISQGPEPKPEQVNFTITYDEINQWVMNEYNFPDETDEMQPATYDVQIYIRDMNYNDISYPAHQFTLSENQSEAFSLTINPGETGEYRILVNGNVYKSEVVPYPGGDDE